MPDKKPAPKSSVPKGTHYGVAAFAVGLGVYIWWATGDPTNPPKPPKPDLHEGAEIDAPITLVTADKQDLACASDKEFEGYHCAFKTPEDTWPDLDTRDPEQRKKMLVPYMTVDDVMFLIPGLFEQPSVDERYRDELPRARSRDKLERFTAQCKLKVRKQWEGVMVRWSPKAEWQGPQKVWIGEVSNCQVSEP